MRMPGALVAAALLLAGAVPVTVGACMPEGARRAASCACAPEAGCGSALGSSCCCKGSDPHPAVPAPPGTTPVAPSDGLVAIVQESVADVAGEADELLPPPAALPCAAAPALFLLCCTFLC